jgi:rhodanese-related sulfurtransferase
MSELPGRLGELPDEDPLYVVCRSGGRAPEIV